MRIAARTSSDSGGALADFPALRDRLQVWRIALAETGWTPWLILALAVFLRLFLLDIKPPHFDEGINGWFVDQMVKNCFYKYDPTNYHGPLHFYVLFLSQTLLGRNLWALRLPVVLVSIGCIWLTLKFEPLVGRTVSRMAALAMAVSPAFVFYGRYSIHEVWLVFFSMLFVLGLLGLWKFGASGYLWCAGMGLTGMILSKETYIIHAGCAVIAAGVCYISNKVSRISDAHLAAQAWDSADLAMVIATGAALIIFFYSGTFLHWSGVKGLYQAWAAWFATGSEGHGHEKAWYYWLRIIVPSLQRGRADYLGYELPTLAGLILCLFSLQLKDLGLRYLAIYGVGTFIVYSYVHYKTPWCIISFIWPLLFIFGAATSLAPLRYRPSVYVSSAIAVGISLTWTISYIREHPDYAWLLSYIAGFALLLIALRYAQAVYAMFAITLCVSLGSAIWLNYFHCTTDAEPYVYVQTYNDIYKLTKPVLTLAQQNPTFYQLTGHVVRTSAYPLPWIFGDFPNVGYYEQQNLPAKVDADFLLVQADRIAEVEAKLKDSYYTEPLRIRSYQDTSKLYLNAKIFKDFFPGQLPNFRGKRAL
jgi:uncharacterized protein (TIGR03663 family)